MPEKIVIIGGGFAGINLAKNLGKDKRFRIILVDKNNYNFFPPLLYQVSTGYLDPSSITYPFRNLFRGSDTVNFCMGSLIEIKAEEKKIVLDNGTLDYDRLVLATGTQTNFFGLETLRKYAIPMKTLEDALQMRNLLLKRLETATRIPDKEARLPWLTMVVAGGGATGVEISGIFAELRKNTIKKEFPELENSGAKIYLINGGNELLSGMTVKSQDYVLKTLKSMGVEVLLNTRVVDYDGERVIMKDGSCIITKNLIWATGITGFAFKGLPETCMERGNRMLVNGYNLVDGTDHIYAIGDACLQLTDPNFETGHPQVAQVAIQQGRMLAKNLIKNLDLKPLEPFKYNDKGSVAIVGSKKAVADIANPKLHYGGFIAWFIWVFIHLLSLINYRNRLRTFYNWSLEYFTQNQDLRMIIRPRDPSDNVDV